MSKFWGQGANGLFGGFQRADAVPSELLLSTGTDSLLLSGDAQGGTDSLALSGS